jgi:MFS family permease
MISLAYFCFGYFAPGATLHLVPYLIGLGYPAAIAALTLSLALGVSALGKLAMGFMADRITGRITLAIDFAALGTGIALFFLARHGAAIALIVIMFGLTLGAPMALFPMVTVESFGLRRFGSIVGLTNLTYTVGTALGPTLSGRIFDKSASYAVAFEIFIVLAGVAAFAVLSCRGLDAERAMLETRIAEADAVKA